MLQFVGLNEFFRQRAFMNNIPGGLIIIINIQRLFVDVGQEKEQKNLVKRQLPVKGMGL